MKASVLFSFFTATIFCFFFSVFFPQLRLVFYAPFLVILFFHSSFITSLWFAAFSGLVIDLFSAHLLGIHAVAYTLSCVLLYRQKRFFKKTPINIAIFTFFLSFVYTMISLLLFFIFETKIKISLLWWLSDLFLMPLLDSVYALIFFALPIKLMKFFNQRLRLKKDERS